MAQISIIIPCFNAAKFIKDTLQSVLEQSFGDVEAICVNDGSSDNTLEILREISLNDERVVVINQPNLGSSDARNSGINASSARYICFLDADDLLPKDALLNLHKSAVEFDSDIVIGNFTTFGKDGTQERVNFIHDEGEVEYDRYFTSFFSQDPNTLPSACTKLYKAQFVKKNDLFFPSGVFTAEDVCFSAKATIRAKKISKINQSVYHYRIGSNNMSGLKNIKVFEDVKSVCGDLESYFDRVDLTPAQKELLSSYLIKTRFLAPLILSNEIGGELYEDMMALTYADMSQVRKKSGFRLLAWRHRVLFYLYEICPNRKSFEIALKSLGKFYLFFRKFT